MDILQIMPLELKKVLMMSKINIDQLYEIRMRIDKPVIFIFCNEEVFININGKFTKNINNAYYIKQKDINELIDYISSYSIYAFEDEIRQGFLTIKGGHRVGIAGRVVADGGSIKTIKNISCINIRVSHEIIGCANKIIPYLFSDNKIMHTLIISPPRCGKTTLLRDIIRQISDGNEFRKGITVGVVDERSEIGACYLGIPQNEIGIRTDILDCCPKSEGMMMLIRSMSPQVIAVDEIGGKSDIEALNYTIKCGCKLLSTIHGTSIEDVMDKPLLGEIIRSGVFERYIILNNSGRPGYVKHIYDAKGNVLYDGK